MRSNITSFKNHQYATLRLKRNKMNTTHTGVLVMLATTGSTSCPVRALYTLFIHGPQLASTPFFACNNTSFTRYYIIDQLCTWLVKANIPSLYYSSHSFRRGAIQHASDNSMLDTNIQKLGQWNSKSFWFYFTNFTQTLYNLYVNFQIRRFVALLQA